MKQQWLAWSDKYLTLTQRERVILAFAMVFLSGYLLFVSLVEPAMLDLRKSKQKLSQRSTELQTLRTQINEIKTALKQDPNERIKQDIKTLRESLTSVSELLENVLTDYVSPELMAKELTALLSTSTEVRVVGVSTSKPERIEVKVPIKEGQENTDIPEYYRHKFNVVVEGQYFSLMALVQKILKQNRQFTVQDLDYQVLEHPSAKMSLELVTVSDSRNVIRL